MILLYFLLHLFFFSLSGSFNSLFHLQDHCVCLNHYPELISFTYEAFHAISLKKTSAYHIHHIFINCFVILNYFRDFFH